jgi:hypothetical protein
MSVSENNVKYKNKMKNCIATSQRDDLSLAEKADCYKYSKINGIRRYHDTYKSIGNYNESTKNTLKKQLRSLLIESDYNIFQLNHTQDKLFNKYKAIDDTKHKMFVKEYQNHLEYLKERFKASGKFVDEDEMFRSETFMKAKMKLRNKLVKRFQLDDEIECMSEEEEFRQMEVTMLPVIPVKSYEHEQLKKKKVEFKLPSLECSLSKDEAFAFDKIAKRKRLSLPDVLKRPDDGECFKAYKLDSESNLVETTAPKRRDFQLHLEKYVFFFCFLS